MMKWYYFEMFVVVGVPVFAMAASGLARARTLIFALMLFSTVMKISVNFQSLETYRGPDRGFEISLTDLTAISLGIALVVARRSSIQWVPYNSVCMLVYYLVACVSTLNAAEPIYGYFTLFKMTKAYMLYWVVYNLFRSDLPIDGLCWGTIAAAGWKRSSR